MGRALDIDARLLQLCQLRYQEALAGRFAADPEATLLLLVGRGSSDPDANGNLAKVARFLEEGYPTGWAGTAYVGVTKPLLEDALPVCKRAGFRRIVVQPYFLFTGVLLKRIYAQVEDTPPGSGPTWKSWPHRTCKPTLCCLTPLQHGSRRP